MVINPTSSTCLNNEERKSPHKTLTLCAAVSCSAPLWNKTQPKHLSATMVAIRDNRSKTRHVSGYSLSGDHMVGADPPTMFDYQPLPEAWLFSYPPFIIPFPGPHSTHTIPETWITNLPHITSTYLFYFEINFDQTHSVARGNASGIDSSSVKWEGETKAWQAHPMVSESKCTGMTTSKERPSLAQTHFDGN